MELDSGKPSAFLPLSLATRLDTIRHDLRMVLANLVGDRPPPFTVRKPLARHLLASPAPASLLATRSLRITRVTRETRDAVSLSLVDPEGKRIAFLPGQFFTVLVDLGNGEILRRAYSISSLPDEDGAAAEVTITIKRVGGGRASNHLNDAAREGDVISVLGPSGSFTAVPDQNAQRHLVLLAGGSGITPLMSITRTLLAREPQSRVSLIYGNRGESDIIYREALAELALDHADRFTLRHVLSSPTEGSSCTRGILDRGTAGGEIEALGSLDAEITDYYICGPEPMMAAAREALLARGVLPARIHEERFSAPARRKTPEAPKAPSLVQIRLGGEKRDVIASPSQTLLEAGLSASLPMPFSCTMGGCGACKVKLLRGEVVSEEPNCLSEEEKQSGYVLACVSRAASPCEVEIP